MKQYICSICGYITENKQIKQCPVCNSCREKFELKKANNDKYLSKYLGIAREIEILDDLKKIFFNECLEVGIYIAMSRIARDEKYLEISKVYKEIAYEEAEHASILAEFIGIKVNKNTEENLKNIIQDEYNATQDKLKLAKKSKEMGLDIIYEKLDKMYKEEIRHGKEFTRLLNKYFENK